MCDYVVREMYLMRTDGDTPYAGVKGKVAYLFCYQTFKNFRPSDLAEALDNLEELLVQDNIGIATTLKVNFDLFVVLGYEPEVLEKLVDNKFEHKFSYVLGEAMSV